MTTGAGQSRTSQVLAASRPVAARSWFEVVVGVAPWFAMAVGVTVLSTVAVAHGRVHGDPAVSVIGTPAVGTVTVHMTGDTAGCGRGAGVIADHLCAIVTRLRSIPITIVRDIIISSDIIGAEGPVVIETTVTAGALAAAGLV